MTFQVDPTSADAFADLFRASVVQVPAGRQIAAQGDDASTVFRVSRGHLRSCVYSESGHRQIVAFSRPGAIIGLANSKWEFSIEAVTDAWVETVPKSVLEAAVKENTELMHVLLNALYEDVAARDRHLLLMSVFPAVERLFDFLEHIKASRGHDGFIALPMCRRDIADYLGVSQETVSRAFTALRGAGKIELCGAGKFRIPETSQAPRRAA